IIAVGPIAELPDGDVHDVTGMVTPGLVNAHTHLCFSGYADHYGTGKEFFDWLQDFGPRNATMSPADWRAAIGAGVDASLRAGVTGVADVVTPPAALPALLASGLAGTGYFEACAVDAERWKRERDEFLAVLDDAADLRATGSLTVGVSPHTVYTLAATVGADLAAIARRRGMRLHPHLAETRHEDVYVRHGDGPFAQFNRGMGLGFELLAGGCGASPATEMDRWGLLGPDSHVAHGVHLDAADRALLRDRGSRVALCPRSNARLRAGEAPVAALRAEGSGVAVGTDSLASAPDLDVAAELPVLRELAVRQGDNGAGLDEWLVHAATRGGARAMGRDDFGVLEPGARADLAVFDVDTTGDDPYRALVSDAAGACVMTVLAGEPMEVR
ncbi:MAG: amidohydrolase family protein, partial [Stackebrandtia sp.]